MEKDQSIIDTPASRSNKRVLDAKAERRIEKASYSPSVKIAIVKKLRDNSRSLKSAKLVNKGKVVIG